MDIMLTGEDQSQADQPNSLAEGGSTSRSCTHIANSPRFLTRIPCCMDNLVCGRCMQGGAVAYPALQQHTEANVLGEATAHPGKPQLTEFTKAARHA
eukprot:1162088-Pelagomonas_calceolata.AAC.7